MAPHRAGQEPEGKTMGTSKIKGKIEALLAKAERTDNEHERDAYNAKAQRLMLEWGIAEADLEAKGEIKPEEVVEEHKDYRGSYAAAMAPFANAVADGMGALRVLKATHGSTTRVYVIGHKSDVANFWMMMNSLEQQCTSALTTWWKNSEDRLWLGRQEGWKARRQFILSFGYTVGQRLRALRTEVQQEATPGAALVLVDKSTRVNEWVDTRYTRLRSSRGLDGGMAGGQAGRAAGQRANLGEKGITTGAKGALR